jgi:hypothetical protein
MQITPHQGAERKECGCRSWLAHWHNHSHQVITVCRVAGCMSMDIKGTQVKKVKANGDRGIYIIPLCKKHSQADGALEIIRGTKLVPLRKSISCIQAKTVREFLGENQ